MPIVKAFRKATGPGWGCTCPAYRPGEPTAATVQQALQKAWAVTVEPGRKPGTFTCWTEPGEKYEVVYDPTSPGGFCKHVLACAPEVAGGWLRLLFSEPKKPSVVVSAMGSDAAHLLRPGTTKTLCGLSILDGNHWVQLKDGLGATCGRCNPKTKGEKDDSAMQV